ncbi:MAG: tetratricopeptide repeat protein [Pseudomonadota bacterium]|nr:tetratricopeptide repeat protein [Pseudomonadota bacterium]
MSKSTKHIELLFSQAQEHHHARRFVQAQQIYYKILKKRPDHPDALNLLGTALAQGGEPEKAVKYLQQAIEIRPDLAPFRVNLGVIFQDLGKFDQAEECYKQSIKIDKMSEEAYYNLAKLYRQLEKLEAALKTYQHLLLLNPERQDALVNIGNIHVESGSLEKAINFFQTAASISSENKQITDQAIINLANTYRRQGEDLKAIEIYGRALHTQFFPGLRIKQAITLPVVYSDQTHIKEVRQRFEKELTKISGERLAITDPALEIATTNFFLAYQALPNRALQEKTAETILKACPALNYIAPHCEFVRASNKKIKIGFISAYFRNHSIGRLMRGLICNVSRDEFEVFIFAPQEHDDPIARSIQGEADKVIIFPNDTFDAQEVIAKEKLDILFYADIGMDIRTYFLAFARLAPVQCVTWGHPDTTGIPNIDYFISSDLIEIDGAGEHYSEKLYKLNTLPTYYYPIEIPSDLLTKSEFGCPPNLTLYLCPQSAIKHHPDLDFIFREILKADKNAMIMVVEGAVKDWSKKVQKRWESRIPDTYNRIKIVPRQTPKNFIALQNAADVILDTPHFSGGNTSLEAFALAKPIVTHDGEFMRGRVTAGMYKMMKINSCIANSMEDYVEIALKLGLNKKYREEVSRRIQSANKVLFKNSKVIDEFELLFKSLFQAI